MPSREHLFDLVASQIAERHVLYLEFAVFQGRATRYWSKLLRNPNSRLHGFDADLYASTLFVLNSLRDVIVPGAYVYFDEFNHQNHELPAFQEFREATGMKFSLVGVNKTMECVMFQRTA
jgi:Macrocin-O-methyltransferase (TylF)